MQIIKFTYELKWLFFNGNSVFTDNFKSIHEISDFGKCFFVCYMCFILFSNIRKHIKNNVLYFFLLCACKCFFICDIVISNTNKNWWKKVKIKDYEAVAVQKIESCSVTSVHRVAAMLDIDPESIVYGDPLPRGWHFILLGGETPRSLLRGDGFPGFGFPMPDMGLPKLVLGSRTVSYQGDIVVGSDVERTSYLGEIVEKETSSGRIAVVPVHNTLRPLDFDVPAIIETQTYFLLNESYQAKSQDSTSLGVKGDYLKTIIPDSTLLFQYSALGFNTHKIHIDREYARNVEGFPDLVVNGGLSALFITEFARVELGLIPLSLKIKYTSPLICDRPLTLSATRQSGNWSFSVYDDKNLVVAVIEVIV